MDIPEGNGVGPLRPSWCWFNRTLSQSGVPTIHWIPTDYVQSSNVSYHPLYSSFEYQRAKIYALASSLSENSLSPSTATRSSLSEPGLGPRKREMKHFYFPGLVPGTENYKIISRDFLRNVNYHETCMQLSLIVSKI